MNLSSDFYFYLGGSRRMAQKYPDKIIINESTDYDYNTQHNDSVVAYLISEGFLPQYGNPEYKDDQAVCFFTNGSVSVITRENIEVYEAAFEMVSAQDYLDYHWKSSHCLKAPFNKIRTRDFFNNLFTIAEGE